MPTKFTDGKRTITLELRERDPQTGQDRPDWSNDFYDTGILEQNEDGAFIVGDLDYLIGQALDWKYSAGDFYEDPPADSIFRLVYVNGLLKRRNTRGGIPARARNTEARVDPITSLPVCKYEAEKHYVISMLRCIQDVAYDTIRAFLNISDDADPVVVSSIIEEIRRAKDAMSYVSNLRWRNEL